MDQPAPAGLALAYRLAEEVALGDAGWGHHVERWTVTVADPRGAPVGYAHVIVLNLGRGVEISDLTDVASGAWREPVGSAAGGPAGTTGDGADADGGVGGIGDHVLVLDRLFIEPPFRGAGLGPVVAALAVGRLGRGCRVAVCFPAPFDGPLPDDERERSITALGRIWATVGFAPRPDGVWVLDLADDTLERATDRLVRRRPDPARRP